MNTSFQRVLLALLLCSLSWSPAASAQPQTAFPLHNQAVFAPLDWPAPTPERAVTGFPGPNYWQQQADYAIAVTLDPATHRIAGTVRITYTNNSPHPLPFLWLQLDQQAFAHDSRNAQLHGPNSRWRGAFADGGFALSEVTVGRNGRVYAPHYHIDGTRMKIELQHPVLPNGGVVDVTMAYSYTIPPFGADRTGHQEFEQGTVYQIAQWYPRMFVFDDVNGWNTMPYLGQGEFYTAFGNYNLELTAPADFVVVATGTLLNEEEVFTPEQVRRLVKARTQAETMHIIREKEVGKKQSRPSDVTALTWRYRAENVRDVAWAASQAFILDAASWEDVLIMSAYPKEAIGTPESPGWERSTAYVRHAVAFYSDAWYRYPYPVAINVAGPVGGMEYPMLIFCSYQARGQALFGVTDHEIGHTWFPMLVGSDERRHGWMDEGFNTFINYFSNKAFYGPDAERLQRYAPARTADRMQQPFADQPSLTYADQIRADGVGFLSYRKPAVGLLLLRNYILGPDRFDPAFQSYIRAWAYKHPQPADFFRSIEQAAGEDLSWFWRGWFYGTATLDQQVVRRNAGTDNAHWIVQHASDLLLPITLKIDYADGTAAVRKIPVVGFFKQDAFPIFPEPGQEIIKLTIDPDQVLPDVDRTNNVWQP
ncbi:MAG: M1 family metallopeptidase [Bacteroidota bacterium]